jgi:hypothetical protein
MAVMSEAEVREWQIEALAFFDISLGAWPEIEQFIAEFAEDATFSDPTYGNFIDGLRRIDHFFNFWVLEFPDVEIETRRVFISTYGAAYDDIWFNLWPYWVVEPPDHPPARGLDLFQFQDGLVTSFILMYPRETLEMMELGCFPVDG